jgi:hypothetical protein
VVGRILDRLPERLGDGRAFIDVYDFPVGIDFRGHLSKTLAEIDVLVAIIGLQRPGARPGEGPRSVDATDPVRVSIESALARRIPVVAVLLKAEEMLRREQLPESLRPFDLGSAIEVRAGRDFPADVDRLASTLRQIIDRQLAPGTS